MTEESVEGKEIKEEGKYRRWEEGKEKTRSNHMLIGKVATKRFIVSQDSINGDWSCDCDLFCLLSYWRPKGSGGYRGVAVGRDRGCCWLS